MKVILAVVVLALLVCSVVAPPPGGGQNPSYLLPTDPNPPAGPPFLDPARNENPLNVNSAYQQQMAGGADGGAAGAGGLNPNGVPPGSLQPGNIPVGVGAGANAVQDFPQFRELVSSMRSEVGDCVNCVFDEDSTEDSH